jgi:hypothetical protein
MPFTPLAPDNVTLRYATETSYAVQFAEKKEVGSRAGFEPAACR